MKRRRKQKETGRITPDISVMFCSAVLWFIWGIISFIYLGEVIASLAIIQSSIWGTAGIIMLKVHGLEKEY